MSGRKNTPWYYYLLNIEVIIFIAVIITTFYLSWKCKNKKLVHDAPLDADYHVEVPWFKRGPIKSRLPVAKPKKRVYKHEERCREIFQNIFQAKFPSTRALAWLKNPVTKKNLELDGYNPNISTPKGKGLAFEYDGEQHARYTSRMHNAGPNEFLYQVKKDQWKDLKCVENKVMLIRIPHFVDFSQLEPYIKEKLRRFGMGNAIDAYERRR